MKPSQYHSNRKPHNWLAYKLFDTFLVKYAPYYQGILYDLGAGESPYMQFLQQYAEQYIAVDWVGSYHNTKVDIAADLNKPLPIEPEVADTVVSLSVLEHLCEPQVMLNEAFRILKSGGVIVLQVPWQWWIHEAPYDYFRYTTYGLHYLFEKAGFMNIQIEPQAGFFTMWILKFNYFTLRLIRGPYLMRFLLGLMLRPVWYIGQILAPLLDKLDRNWIAETSGYFVTASKP